MDASNNNLLLMMKFLYAVSVTPSPLPRDGKEHASALQ